jgi:CRISPR-associated endonuclease/helicase Cas3
VQTFDEFFRAATTSKKYPNGCRPHGYQSRIARDGLPAVLEAPTGTGKTGIILAWLWRLLSADHGKSTPRRLIFALPQRSLVDQVFREAERWLASLDLTTDTIALHMVMGGRGDSQWQWRQDMDKPAIVVGTVDSLVSKALNRGYGIGRAIYPVDFALVTNGAHWVIDEIQLCRESTTTLRQLAAFAERYETAEPFGLTCMSATVPPGLLETVDNPVRQAPMTILPEERTDELAVRLDAKRTVRKLDAMPSEYTAIAKAALDLHRHGELTLVVLNTVDAAKEVYKHVRKSSGKATLLHSRFRGIEREQLLDTITTDPEDRIVVATQVVEAGIDLNASVLITEAAPWPSVVQRAGRCNRTGRIQDAELCWIKPKNAPPYEQLDLDATAATLENLEGRAVSSEDLLQRDVEVTEEQVSVLRSPDFLALFDTSPDLAGNDIDVAPYVRDADDLDAQVAWATWATEDGRPPEDAKSPSAEYRCRVPLGKMNELAKAIPVWRLDQVLHRWARVTPQARARPGEVLVISADAGGYDAETGFEPSAKGPVPGCPPLQTKAEPRTGTEDAYGNDSSNVQQKRWLSLDQHSVDVRDRAAELLASIEPDLPARALQSAIAAGYLHDVGKAYKTWQDALCDLAEDECKDEIQAGRPWAKSGGDGQLHFEGGVNFRHELASLLILDGPLRPLLEQAPDQDLARYLVLAHHGKLRTQVRDPGDLAVVSQAEAGEKRILGLEHGQTADFPAMLNQPASQLTISLDQFELGNDRSWTRTVSDLLDRYGPFRLAYLEAIVRVADWRASANATEAK